MTVMDLAMIGGVIVAALVVAMILIASIVLRMNSILRDAVREDEND